MSQAADFVRDGRLRDIEYRTDAPEEVVCPRVTHRDGVAMVYLHNERDEDHQGFVPVATFLQRLARKEPGLAATGYRANGRQTTISFNKADCVTLSSRLQAYLSSLSAPRGGKSVAIVGFLANLMPLYTAEQRDGVWCARSLQDGTLILPVDETDWDEERGTVRVLWQGDSARASELDGSDLATLALERYVRLHGVGASEESIAAELWFMAEHFRFKTGCSLYLPQLREPAHPAMRAAKRMGEGVLVNALSKLMGA